MHIFDHTYSGTEWQDVCAIMRKANSTHVLGVAEDIKVNDEGISSALFFVLQNDIAIAAQNSCLQWASYQIRKIAGCACAGNAEGVSPAADFKANR